MSIPDQRDSVFIGTVYNDPGAVAFDNIDGNITSSLSAYGIGAVSTSKPTGNSYFTITYTVQVSQHTETMLCMTHDHVMPACLPVSLQQRYAFQARCTRLLAYLFAET